METIIRNITSGLQLGQNMLSYFGYSASETDEVVSLGVGAVMPNELPISVLCEISSPRSIICDQTQ